MAVEVLTTADGRAKTALSHKHAATWFAAREAGEPLPIGAAEPPLRPSRPEKPELLSPRDVPRRRPGSPQGRIALLHAVAHIELNAVDLHWDIVARFAHEPMPMGFYDDWVKAADEESKHFNLVCDCLEAMDSHLWGAACTCRYVESRRRYSARFHGTVGSRSHGPRSSGPRCYPRND